MNNKTILNQLKKDLLKFQRQIEHYNDLIENWNDYYGQGKKDSIGLTKTDNKNNRNMLIGRTSYLNDLIDKFDF
jgi:hypothetical protein